MTTINLVSYFKAGLTMHELAERTGVSVAKIEQAIRRWMQLYPEGKKS